MFSFSSFHTARYHFNCKHSEQVNMDRDWELNKDFIDAINVGDSYANLNRLLLKGADINHKSETHWRKFTALHFAVEGEDEKLVKWLLIHRADKTIRDDFGKTAAETAQQRRFKYIAAIINYFEPLSKIDGEIIYQLNLEHQRAVFIKRGKVLHVLNCNNIYDLLTNQMYYNAINESLHCFVTVVQLRTEIPFLNLAEYADKFDDKRPMIFCIESEMSSESKIFYKDTNCKSFMEFENFNHQISEHEFFDMAEREFSFGLLLRALILNIDGAYDSGFLNMAINVDKYLSLFRSAANVRDDVLCLRFLSLFGAKLLETENNLIDAADKGSFDTNCWKLLRLLVT
jgi:Ankyrin repeats (many copies)